jgi:hypothetical protein
MCLRKTLSLRGVCAERGIRTGQPNVERLSLFVGLLTIDYEQLKYASEIWYEGKLQT